MDYHIIKISRNKKQYLDLLLLGDEQETMIDRYLERGDLFVLEDNGIKAVGVVTKEGPEICELKNIAVTPFKSSALTRNELHSLKRPCNTSAK